MVSAGPTSLRPESDHRIYTCTEPHEYVAAVGIINYASFSPISASLSLSLAAFLRGTRSGGANAKTNLHDDVRTKGQSES